MLPAGTLQALPILSVESHLVLGLFTRDLRLHIINTLSEDLLQLILLVNLFSTERLHNSKALLFIFKHLLQLGNEVLILPAARVAHSDTCTDGSPLHKVHPLSPRILSVHPRERPVRTFLLQTRSLRSLAAIAAFLGGVGVMLRIFLFHLLGSLLLLLSFLNLLSLFFEFGVQKLEFLTLLLMVE